jgi:hypothetical protein
LPTKVKSAVLKWIKEPSSWLALTASIISIATFFLVYADHGTVDLILPDRVGMKYDALSDTAEMLLPLTFTNTGAPRTQRHVLRVTALVSPAQSPAAGNTDPAFAWEYEKVFIGKLEWEKRYPDWFDKYPEDRNNADFVDYLGRALAFSLHGGESKSKLFNMLQSNGKLSGRSLSDFALTVEALLEDSNKKVAGKYSCIGPVVNTTFKWCKRTNL